MKLVPDAVRSAFGKLRPSSGSSDPEPPKPPSASEGGARESEAAAPDAPPPFDAQREDAPPSEQAGSEAKASADEPEAGEADAHETADANRTADEPEAADPTPGPDATADSGHSDQAGGEDDSDNLAEDITAPSIGPNTVIDHRPPEERLDHDKISKTDAFGLDKRRGVTGKRYSASPARQVITYALFIVIVAALVIGGKALATKLDEPPATVKAKAPWAGTERPTESLDFPQYGEPAS